MNRKLAWVTPLVISVLACNSGIDLTGRPKPGFGPGTIVVGEVGLKRFQSAEEFQEYFSSQVAADRRSGLRGEVFLNDAVDLDAPSAGAESDAGSQAPTAAPTDGDGEAAASENFSTTTTQEAGVQEADIIKNDGKYVYVLSGSMLRIVQSDPGEDLQELASIPLEGFGRDLYLRGDRVVALTQPNGGVMGAFPGIPEPLAAQEMIASPDYFRPRIQVTVIDATDRTNPEIESKSFFEGSLSSSRMIGDVLHLVLVNYPEFFEPVIALRDGEPEMAEVTVDEILPDFAVEIPGDEPVAGNTIDWSDVHRPIEPDGYGMTTVLSLDINSPEDFKGAGVVAYPGLIYASTEALYLTNAAYNFFGVQRQLTDIYKFALTEDGPVAVAVGAVPGRILNQYSMSEYEGNLRVATTIDRRFDVGAESPSTNNVYVLDQMEEELSIVGSAEGLAPTEQIFSARFAGPRGYLVTFRQIDPLFTLDLSDPTDPRVVGTLKIPGFSTFIMEMGESHLLTIGQDALVNGEFVRPQGVQLSVFDISNFADPQLVHTELVGTPDAWSQALHDPKALTYFAAQDLLAVPVEFYGDGFGILEDDIVDPDADVGAEIAPPPEPFRGLYVYRVTPENGFESLGQMSTTMDGAFFYSSFTRGVFMNQNVFGVTDHGVVGAPVNAVDTAPWNVTFPPMNEDVFPVEGDGGTVGVTEPEPAETDPADMP